MSQLRKLGEIDTKTPAASATELTGWVTAITPRVATCLPLHLKPSAERYAMSLVAEYRRNPLLAECSGMSLLGAALGAATLGLEIGGSTAHTYLVPYWNSKLGAKEAQLQIGWRGWAALVRRSGTVKDIYAHAVYENDEFKVQLGTDQRVHHVPARGDRGKLIGVYAAMIGLSGGVDVEYMSKVELDKHRARFVKEQKYKSKAWEEAEDEMCRKTVFKRICKRADISIEMRRAIDLDTRADDEEPQNLRALVVGDASVESLVEVAALPRSAVAEEIESKLGEKGEQQAD